MLALQRIPNLGDSSAKKLLQHIGSAEGIFKEKKQNLLRIDGIGTAKIKELNQTQLLDAAEEELHFMDTHQIRHHFFKDPDYPERLKQCLDGPILLFSKGNFDLHNKRIISIVGTRNATTMGITNCEQLVSDLASLNPVIVSGFAYGIDITAHKAAMNNGLQTVACIAHGLDQIYPKSHKKFIAGVQDFGCLMTEFWSSDSFDRNNFLKRNRIIAGMSEATIVIESGEKGGSLVTADIANSYNREVFAVPGRITDRQSVGCNNLIKTQQAQLLTGAADLVYMLGWDLNEQQLVKRQFTLFDTLTDNEQLIVAYLKEKDKVLLDIIAHECNMPTNKVASVLLNLELKGLVQPLPGKLFQLG